MAEMTNEDVPVAKVLAGAEMANLDEVVIIGYNKDGGFYFASSKASGPEILWSLEYAKKKLLAIVDE